MWCGVLQSLCVNDVKVSLFKQTMNVFSNYESFLDLESLLFKLINFKL